MSKRFKFLVGNTESSKVRLPETGATTAGSDIVIDDPTGDEIAWDFRYTVNKLTSGNDTGLKITKTNVLSPATSYMLDLDGSMTVDDAGNVVVSTKVTAPSFVGNVYGNLDGNVSGGIAVFDESSDTTCFPVFATGASGTQLLKTDTSDLTYNASLGTLYATNFVAATSVTAGVFIGPLAGNVTGDVTGDVTGNVTGNVNAADLRCTTAYTVATLPAGQAGQIARVTDGDAALAWGATAVNSGGGAASYLVWYNGTNWTVIGK